MYYLVDVIPFLRNRRLPLTRDQLMLLMAAINLLFLGLDTYLAHLISGTIRPREWIPIIFGATAGVIMLLAGLIAVRHRFTATVLATLVMISSIVVGVLGTYFHLVRGGLPTAPAGQRLTVELLVWAPPVAAPLIFSLVGLWGLSAAWIENPPDSGRLLLWRERTLRLPYSKTRAYLFIVSIAALATLLSSVFDHARAQFENPWLWLPLAAGVFATVTAAALAVLPSPSRSDVMVYAGGMVLMMLVGLIGAVLHVQLDLTAAGAVVIERFIRGAPSLAPLLFANVGLLGLIAVLSPAEEQDRGAREMEDPPVNDAAVEGQRSAA